MGRGKEGGRERKEGEDNTIFCALLLLTQGDREDNATASTNGGDRGDREDNATASTDGGDRRDREDNATASTDGGDRRDREDNATASTNGGDRGTGRTMPLLVLMVETGGQGGQCHC